MKRQPRLGILRAMLIWLIVLAGQGSFLSPTLVDAAQAFVQVQDAHGPWVNLTITPALDSEADASLQAALGQPLALAAADFDGNGTPDLAAGYTAQGGGQLALYHGNVPVSRDTVSFAAAPMVLGLPGVPDFLFAGDFNADGLPDLFAAARGGEALWLLPGKGAEGFGALERLKLPGALTALTAGELYRQDGLSDLAAGVETPTGAELLVFAGRDGAVLSPPEIYALPAPAVALAIGELDDAFPYDLAIAAGSTLAILHGHDQLDVEASVATLETFALDFVPVSLALGDFRVDDAQIQELALLGEDGVIRLFNRQGSWLDNLPAVTSGRGRLLSLRISSLPATELLVIGQEQAQILSTDGQWMTPAATFEQVMTPGKLAALGASKSIAAILPLRLNNDQLDDLVLLTEQGLTLALTTAFSTFLVNTAIDGSDNNPGDNKCEATLINGLRACTLRAAIQEANAHPGLDVIEYNSEGYTTITPETFLPDITETATLRHTLDDRKLIFDGRSLPAGIGINIRGSDIAVSEMTLTNFTATSAAIPVIKVSSGTNNTIGKCQIGPNNGGLGVQLATGGNRIHHSIIAGNGTGVLVSSGSGNIIGPENTIGRGIAGSNATNATAIEVSGATNTRISAADPLYGYYWGPNVISGNSCQGIMVQGTTTNGTVFLKNHIGVNAAGDQALSNGCTGIYIKSGAAATTIGNDIAGDGNVISANSTGILINQAYPATVSIRGNFIGVNAAATAAMANATNAIYVDTVGAIQIEHNYIGGAPTSAWP